MSENSNFEIDIQKVWNKMAKEKFSNNEFKKQEIMDAIKKESNTNIADLRKKLKGKLMFAVGFTIMFVVLTMIGFLTDHRLFIFGVGFTVMYGIGSYAMFKKYKEISQDSLAEDNILDEMKRSLYQVKSTLNVEKIWGVIMFMSMASAFSAYVILNPKGDSPTRTVIEVIAFIVICVLAWIGSNKMNEIGFGRTIKKLETDIIRLETFG